MKIYKSALPACYLVFTILSCNQTNNERSGLQSPADSTVTDLVSSSAAVENGKDTTRKFIRTADLKFKVKSVIKSTYDIEDITSRQGGFVTVTNLTSNVNNFTTIAVSADSSLETTYFTTANSMVLRVPNIKLDTTLKEIAKNIQYLDYRIIKAADVGLTMLSNTLSQMRSNTSEKRLTNAIDNKVSKLGETTIAEDVLQSKQERNDNARISNLLLTDQVSFSTIILNIYERQAVKRELVSNEKNIEGYEAGFGQKFFESVRYGWYILEAFVLFLARLWAILLLSFVAYFIYKRYRPRLS